MGIKINRLKESIDAEVEGVDITAPIDEQTFRQLQDAVLFNAADACRLTGPFTGFLKSVRLRVVYYAL